jgi:hypothetical protein
MTDCVPLPTEMVVLPDVYPGALPLTVYEPVGRLWKSRCPCGTHGPENSKLTLDTDGVTLDESVFKNTL